MKKVILLSQLICMSMLFAPRDSRERPSIASTESLPSLSRSALSSPSREAPSSPLRDVLSLSALDCAMFKHWYGDCFKTKEIDGVTYFIELPERESKSPFVFMGMSGYTQVSSLSVTVVENDFSSKHAPIFNTSNERPIRFKYTINQKVQFGEAKDIFNTIVPKAKQMMQDMLDELNDAYRYGYKSHLPLDSIEVQDESGTIYLICGIEQSSAKNYWISEPESIRIKIKASKQCPESFRMSKKHLLAPLLTSCPEFYMSRRYLGMYHTIYSALNEELVESLKDISKFPKVEGYSQIPDSLQTREWFNKAKETIEYLQENELEPFIYIPTYQHDMLAEGIPTYQRDMLAKSMDKDEDYGSLIFTFSNYRDDLAEFKTEVVNDLQYTLCTPAFDGLTNTLRLSHLIGKETSLELGVSLFCPAPGKFKQSSGNTEFRHTSFQHICEYKEDGPRSGYRHAESLADAFKNALQEAKTIRDKIIGKLSEIKSVDFPLALVGEWPRYYDEPQTVFKFIGSEGARLGYSLGYGDNEPCSFEEFLTEEHLIAYRDVCNLVGRGVRELLSGVTEFNDKEGYSYRDVPQLLKIQSFWSKVEEILKKQSFWSKLKAVMGVDLGVDYDEDEVFHEYLVIQIPRYQYDALIDKQHELLPFTRDKGNVFKTADTDSGIYSLTLSSASSLDDTCKLSDLRRKKITNLSVHHREYEYNINKLMSGDEVSEQFKIGSQMIRKLENARLDEATVNVDERVKIECRGDIPHKYGYRSSDSYKLKIRETDHTILRKFLTEDRLKACKDLCELIKRNLSKLLSKSYVKKDDEKDDEDEDYVYVPKLLTVQPFWPRAQALLNQIGFDVSISIPRWIHNTLTDSLPEACDASSNSDDDETSKDCEEGYGNEF